MTTEELMLIIEISVFTLIVVIFIIMIISYFLTTRQLKNKIQLIADANVRIFVLNFENGTVVYFDKKSLREKKSVSFERFFLQFQPEEIGRVKEWINNLRVEQDVTSHFLETKVIVKSKKDSSFSLLKATSIDNGKKIIHLESSFLPFLKKSSVKNKSFKSSTNSIDEVRTYLNNKFHSKTKGGLFLFRIFSTYEYELNYSKENLKYLFVQIENILASYLEQSSFIIKISEYELVLINTSISSNEKTLYTYGHMMLQAITKFMHLSALGDSYDVSLGAISLQHKEEFSSLLKKARDSAMLSETFESELKISIYENDAAFNRLKNSDLSSEIRHIIAERSFRYFYSPLVDVKQINIAFYLVEITPYGATFNNLDELLEYAFDFHLVNLILDIVANTSIAIFNKSNKVGGAKLILPVKISHLAYVVELLKEHAAKVVFLLEETEMIEWKEENDGAQLLLKLAQKSGALLALKFQNPISNLSHSELELFDYFVVDREFTFAYKNDERKKINLNTLFDFLEKYHKPYLALSVESFSSIDIFASLGIKVISSLSLAQPSPKAELLDEKIEQKLKLSNID